MPAPLFGEMTRDGHSLWQGEVRIESHECLTGDKVMQKTIEMPRRKNIALVAHDNKKEELVAWARLNSKILAEHSLYATRTTGELLKSRLGLKVTLLESGILGGDQQIGARVSEGRIDFVIFFSDPLQSQPHDADVKALLRIIVVWNVPLACNRASADFIMSSPLMSRVYERLVPSYPKHRFRLAGSMRSKPVAERATESLIQSPSLGILDVGAKEEFV
jgi:methylglyoxal synthase